MQSSIDLVQSNAALVVLHTVSTPGCPATLLPFARLQREKPRMAESKQGGATDVADSDGGWEHPRAHLQVKHLNGYRVPICITFPNNGSHIIFEYF